MDIDSLQSWVSTLNNDNVNIRANDESFTDIHMDIQTVWLSADVRDTIVGKIVRASLTSVDFVRALVTDKLMTQYLDKVLSEHSNLDAFSDVGGMINDFVRIAVDTISTRGGYYDNSSDLLSDPYANTPMSTPLPTQTIAWFTQGPKRRNQSQAAKSMHMRASEISEEKKQSYTFPQRKVERFANPFAT